jgi:Bacteriophage Rz lysis protein
MRTVLLTLAGVAALVAAIYAIEWKGHASGVQDAKLEAEQLDNSALRESKRALDAMHRRVEKQERDHAAELSKLAKDHLKGVRNAEAERDRALADVRAGRLRLRGPAPKAAGTGAGERMPATTAGPAGSGVAAEAGGLPDQRAEFLVREAARCDAIVGELNYCWSVVRKDREIVNKPRAAVDGG